MSGARRCCCVETNVPTEECGCDGPLYISIESLNAQQITTVCQATPICSGDTPNGWNGNQIVTTLEAQVLNLPFECENDPDLGYVWNMKAQPDNDGTVTLTLGTTGDDFDFSSALTGSTACDDTFTPFGLFELDHPLSTLPDATDIIAYEGWIRNVTVLIGGLPETRAKLHISIWLRYHDLYDVTWLFVDNPLSPTIRQGSSPNPPVSVLIRVEAVGDQPYGDGVCPSDIVWTTVTGNNWWLEIIPDTVGQDITVGHVEESIYVDCAPPGSGDCTDLIGGTSLSCSDGSGGIGTHPLFPALSFISHWSTWTADTANLSVSETPI